MATRTWVSGVGDDVNPGSRTAPCKTFAGAISKTDPKGEIDVIDPGGFGAVTITKAITIDGAGTFASILGSGVTGITINAGAGDIVTLRNLSINGGGTGINGINFLAGAALHIDNCVIFGFTQKGVFFEPSGNARLFIDDSTIRNNGSGVVIQPGAAANVSATLNNVRLEENPTGVSGTDRCKITVSNSLITGSSTVGVSIKSVATAAELSLESCMVAHNNANAGSIGVLADGAAAVIRISNVMLFNNSLGLSSVAVGIIQSFTNNRNRGNTTNGAPTQSVAET